MSTFAGLRDLTSVAPLIKSGALSPVDLVQTCLDRITEKAELNAFISVLGDRAIAEARAAEQAIRAGNYRGPLHGIPISVKDLIDVAGVPTTSGSALPAQRASADAPIVTRLRSAGAIIIGKTNLHEFAFGTTSDETAFGPVRHPKDPSRSPGGSSGGAAVALVEGMCFGSVGTDTGGSIRIPSAVCGIVGLKPTFGELPCEGIVPLSASLDHVGPMARTVNDVRAMFRAMKGTENETDAQIPAGAKKVFGVPESYFCDRLTPEVREAFERARRSLSAAGHDVVVVEIGGAAWTPDVYLHIVLPEASCYHAPTLESHPEGYSPGVRLRLEMGRYILAEDMARALRLREVLTHAVDGALQRCDALLLPTQPIPAPPIGAASIEVDGQSMPTRAAMLRLTQLFNMSGHPAIAIPAGATPDGWPVSIQLVGVRGDTEGLLTTASAVESQITGGPGSVGGGTG
jgi:aspartyl-tRNA(Asn)/glutamyl-tRNA(Gln) amidotransferase subunit A